ncbi:MAG: SAF domain-containing protein [Desulfotomaculales bacterium]
MKKALPLAAALFLALVAGLLVYVSLQATKPNVPVVAARANLSVGHVIGPSDVTVKKLPPVAVPEDSFRTPERVIGKAVVAGPVLAGDVVRAAHLAAEGSLAAALATFAPPGWVAVELPQNTGMGMVGLRRGDKVDIYTDVPEKGVALVVGKAVVISTPWTTVGEKDKASAYVVAVPPEHGPVLAEVLAHNRRVALVLVRGE